MADRADGISGSGMNFLATIVKRAPCRASPLLRYTGEFDRHERLHDAAAELPIDGVEAGGGYLHLDLARSGFGFRDLLQGKLVGVSILIQDDRFHGSLAVVNCTDS